MNGKIDIELGGVKTPLYFGMMAVEQFSRLQGIGDSGYSKMLTDLVYSGYCNEKTLDHKNPELSYRALQEAMEDLLISKDPILAEVFKCFEDSKAGAYFMEEVKKKLADQNAAGE